VRLRATWALGAFLVGCQDPTTPIPPDIPDPVFDAAPTPIHAYDAGAQVAGDAGAAVLHVSDWQFSRLSPGFAAHSDATVSYLSAPTAMLSNGAATTGTGYAWLQTGQDTFSVAPYIGHRVRMTGMVRAVLGVGGVGLTLIVYDGAGNVLTQDLMAERPIESAPDFAPYVIVVDVPPNATRMEFGLLLPPVPGPVNGQAWLGQLAFEIVDDSVPRTN